MKKYHLLIIIFIALLASCSEQVDPPFEAEVQDIYEAKFFVNFVDNDGRTLAAGLSGTSTDKYKRPKIDNDHYKLYHNFGDSTKSMPAYNLFYASSRPDDFYLEFGCTRLGEPIISAEFVFKCRKIFGDNEFHIMKVDFDESSESNHFYYCNSFTLDGNKYPVEEHGHVTVSLNQE